MRTARPHYRIITKLPERAANHPYAWLVAVLDEATGQLFTSNTCDVHERLAPWDGGRPSQYDHNEVLERITMLKGRVSN